MMMVDVFFNELTRELRDSESQNLIKIGLKSGAWFIGLVVLDKFNDAGIQLRVDSESPHVNLYSHEDIAYNAGKTVLIPYESIEYVLYVTR